MPSAAPPSLGSFASISRILVKGCLHRGELATLELSEAWRHVISTLVVAAISGAFLLLGGFAGTIAIAAAVWNRGDRGMILGIATLVYLAIGAVLSWWAVQRARRWKPMPETRFQLREDSSCIHQLLTEHES